jgi:TRAP-type mannitol/chloroaromatic compound transport system substrate-binding protein
MKRRQFLTTAGVATAAAAVTAACSQQPQSAAGDAASGAAAAPAKAEFRWKLVTTWPPNFPGLGTGANLFAELIEKCSNGRIRIKVYGATELVPAFEVFDAVARGTAELGHAGAYYWKGKAEAASFFSAIPFGFTPAEMNGWLYFGGGMELWRETYAPFGVLPLASGNSGCQMGGWFNREIRSIADLKGLKMRIPGIGGEVFARAGGTPVTLAGGEIFTALETGAIDAAEFIGPYNDLAFGLYKAAKYYYYPGWQEPGSALECLVNRAAFDKLPADLQEIVRTAARAVNDNMLAEMTARSAEALDQLVNVHKVQLRPFPPDVLKLLREMSEQICRERAAADPMFGKTYASFTKYRDSVVRWTRIADEAYLAARSL